MEIKHEGNESGPMTFIQIYGQSDIFKFLLAYKEVGVSCTSKALYGLLCSSFPDKVAHNCNSSQVECFFTSLLIGTFLVDTHYQQWNFICSYGYMRSEVTALSSGQFFLQSFIRINPCLPPWQHISFEHS